MKYFDKHPLLMIVIGVIGIGLSSIFVRLSEAPSAVTAAWRLLWTVGLMSPVVLGKVSVRQEIIRGKKKQISLSILSGVFLAIHFVTWFESLKHTSVASSTTIVCTEVIWVSLGYCLFLKGKLRSKAVAAIAVTFLGSVMIALADSGSGAHLYGDVLALVAAVAVGIYTLIGGQVRKNMSTSAYTYIVYLSCAACLMAACGIQELSLVEYGFRPVIVGCLLAVFSTILGHSIFSWCLKYFSPSFVSASKLCEPVVSAVIAAFLFREIPGLWQVAGAVLILTGVLSYSRLERSQ